MDFSGAVNAAKMLFSKILHAQKTSHREKTQREEAKKKLEKTLRETVRKPELETLAQAMACLAEYCGKSSLTLEECTQKILKMHLPAQEKKAMLETIAKAIEYEDSPRKPSAKEIRQVAEEMLHGLENF